MNNKDNANNLFEVQMKVLIVPASKFVKKMGNHVNLTLVELWVTLDTFESAIGGNIHLHKVKRDFPDREYRLITVLERNETDQVLITA